MKRVYIALSLVLVVAVVLSGLLMFGSSATEPVPEAQLTVTPEGGVATTEVGTLDEVITRLNASLSPEVATAYEVKLLTNATQSVAANLEGNGNESVTVDLDGYTLTSGTTSDLYTVDGVAKFNLVGGFTKAVELGRVVSGKISGNLLAIPATATAAVAELSDVEIEYSGLNPDGSVLDLGAGKVMLRNASIIYTGKANALGSADRLSLVKVGEAALTLSLSNIVDESASGVVSAVYANGATLCVERGEIVADYAFDLAGASHATLIDPEVVATAAVFTADSVETDNAVHTGGIKINAPHIISGGIGKEDITLWYGTGSTYIVGVDPLAEVTLATSLTSLKAIGNAYTLAHSYTSTAILTTMPDGGTPTEATNEFKITSFYNATPSVPTAYILAFLKDYTYTGNVAAMTTGHENAAIFLDYNGKNIFYSNEKNSNIMSASGSYRFMIDGADAEGKHATVTSNRSAGALLYDKSGTEDAVFAISGCDIVYQHDTGKNPILQLCGGFSYVYNNKFTYTGEAVTTAPTDATVIPMVTAQSTSKPFVYDCEFYHASTVENITTTALTMTSTAVGYYRAKDLKIYTTKAVSMNSTTKDADLYLANSEVSCTAIPYSAASSNAPLYISDTTTRIPVTEAASGYTYFLVGNGKNRVITETGKISGGKFEEGFSFSPTSEENVFIVACNNITLNHMFSTGMVLQAGKPTNVYGTSIAEGSTVTVKIGDIATASAVVEDGKWCATFENLPYAKGVDIVVTDDVPGSSTTTVYDVDLGEVWVMSGQSNSVYDVTNMDDFEEYLALADMYDIKAYIVKQSSSMVEKTETDSKWHTIDKAWLTKQAGTSLSSKHSVGLSAVAYVMATRLATELPDGVTVAIIDANFNGSGVQNWADYDVLKTLAPTYAETYKLYYDAYVENGNVYPTEEQMLAKGVAKADYIASDRIYGSMPTACYNAMIKPLEGFSVKGTVWYQGEGNGGSVTATTDAGYTARWKSVRQTFRNTFGGDESLPMFVIQIPPYFATLAEFKALQYKMVEDDENSYVVSNTMNGPIFSNYDFISSSMSDNMVHYSRKSPLGISLAASILENIYGMGQLSMPKVVSVKADGSTLKLTLDRDFELMWGEEIVGFELAGSDGVFKAAIATVKDGVIILHAPGVVVPKAVRYGFGKAVFEMEDGSTLTLDKELYTFTNTKLTTTTNGKTDYKITITDNSTGEVLYTFISNETPIIRCRGTGNVASTTGQTLPVFKITLK